MEASTIKETLLDTNYFIDNEFLDKYCACIALNEGLANQPGRTQRHHVIPVCYYKKAYEVPRKEALAQANGDPKNFKINLYFQDHIKVHYYLCRCCLDVLFPGLFNALDKQLRGDPNNKQKRSLEQIEQLIKENGLENYQKMYEQAKACEFKSVICIETQQVFNSVKEASHFIGTKLQREVLLNYKATARGYHFAYSSDTEKIKALAFFIGKPPYLQKELRARPIICIETQQTFASIKQCAQTLNCLENSLQHVLYDGERFRGYHFAYLDDAELQKQLQDFVGKPPESKEERSKRLSESRKKAAVGRVYSEEYRKALSDRSSKSIICIETQRVYKSAKEACQTHNPPLSAGALSSALTGRVETCDGYHWAFLHDTLKQESLKSFIGKPRCALSSAKKASLKAQQNRIEKQLSQVICIETQQIFNSASEAAEQLHMNASCISAAAHKGGYGGGYHWARIKDQEMIQALKAFVGKPRLEERPATLKNQKRVRCIELNIIFPSQKDAAAHFNINKNTLGRICTGRRKNKMLGGYTWEYVD